MVRVRTVGAVVLGVYLLTLVVPAWAASPDPHSEASFVADINAERTSRGLAALTVTADLVADARQHAEAMAAQQRLFDDPHLAADVPGGAVAENSGMGPSVPTVHQAFMASPSHRANILGGYSQVGVGVVWTGSTLWVAEVFRQPSTTTAPAPATPPTTAAPVPSTTAAPAPSTGAAPPPSAGAGTAPSTAAAHAPSTAAGPAPSTAAPPATAAPPPSAASSIPSTTAAPRAGVRSAAATSRAQPVARPPAPAPDPTTTTAPPPTAEAATAVTTPPRTAAAFAVDPIGSRSHVPASLVAGAAALILVDVAGARRLWRRLRV